LFKQTTVEENMMELVHNRELSIGTYDLGDHCIFMEGRLTDHRHRARRGETSESPKIVHDMVIRLKIRGPEMLIEEADAKMPHHPREECTVVLPWIRKLEGLRITAGFTAKVKKSLGDIKGCAHLTSLVIAMGPSAVQGYWAAYGVEREKIDIRDEAVKKVINTCYLWREDGSLVKKLRKASESRSSSECNRPALSKK
jgi:hypothetical protein